MRSKVEMLAERQRQHVEAVRALRAGAVRYPEARQALMRCAERHRREAGRIARELGASA